MFGKRDLLHKRFNPLSANGTKWSNTFKQLIGNLSTNCLSAFDHFVGVGFKGLKFWYTYVLFNNESFNALVSWLSDSLQTAAMSMSFEYRFSVMRNAKVSGKSFLCIITFYGNAFIEDLFFQLRFLRNILHYMTC